MLHATTKMFSIFTIITLTWLNGAHRGACAQDTSTWNPKLETDCSGPPAPNQVAAIPDVSYPFRTDLLTLLECKAYERVPCTDTEFDSCDVDAHGETQPKGPFAKTYFELDCGDNGWRSFLQAFTKKFSTVSAKRALTVKILERNDTKDPVHSDVFEPVRDQVIDLKIYGTTTLVTSKIYGIGMLPSLVALHILNVKNLSIKRRDFNMMPNVRLIVFEKSTIAQIEPYTFTDLPHLGGLSVDKGLWDAFYDIRLYNSMQNKTELIRNLTLEGRHVTQANLWTVADFDKIHRIHCDCSFAWYRNFLKSKPELIENKQAGAMTIIGNYMSDFFSALIPVDSHVIAVDCAQNVTEDNYYQEKQFSYNATCFGPC